MKFHLTFPIPNHKNKSLIATIPYSWHILQVAYCSRDFKNDSGGGLGFHEKGDIQTFWTFAQFYKRKFTTIHYSSD